jgi:hypothetical protein
MRKGSSIAAATPAFFTDIPYNDMFIVEIDFMFSQGLQVAFVSLRVNASVQTGSNMHNPFTRLVN